MEHSGGIVLLSPGIMVTRFFLFREHRVFAVKDSGKYKGKYAGINNVHANGNEDIYQIYFKGEDGIHAKHAVVNRNKEHADFL